MNDKYHSSYTQLTTAGFGDQVCHSDLNFRVQRQGASNTGSPQEAEDKIVFVCVILLTLMLYGTPVLSLSLQLQIYLNQIDLEAENLSTL